MADIAQHLPQESPTVAAIYAAYKRAGDAEPHRGYLGASIIGHSCERYLWYCFRGCCRPEFSGRMYRLFERGDLEEARFSADLRAIGCTVHEVDPDTGKQFEVTALGGHFSGHTDGCALGIPEAPNTWHVLEFKTHNAKSFAKLAKEGVKKAKPQHYAQMQTYMHLTGLTRALYLATNKDTDEIYAERVYYDKAAAESLMARAERVITATTPPERISTRPDYFECGWCDAKAVCWGSATSALPIHAVSCRQCCHATPKMDGRARWACEKHGRSLSEGDQARACDDHLVLPGLIGFAEPLDYDDGCIIFNGESGQWKHGKGGYSTRELTTLPASALSNEILAAAKELFDATVTNCSPDDILSRYPKGDSRTVWEGEANKLVEAWRKLYLEDLYTMDAVAKCEEIDYQAAEFPGERVAIVWLKIKTAEIREGVS